MSGRASRTLPGGRQRRIRSSSASAASSSEPGGRRVDRRERGQRALDARRLAARAEVGAHARAQVAGLADVERLAEAVAHDVHAGAAGQAGREVAPLPRPARRGQRERHHVLGALRAALLREADQPEQHLGRGQRVGQRTVAGADRHVEALRDAAEVEARQPAGQQAAREPDRVEHAHADARAVEAHEGAIEHADVEGRVVRDEHAAAGEREELGQRRAQGAGAREVAVADARDLA